MKKWLNPCARIIAVASLGVGVTALLGHVFLIHHLYEWGADGKMSLPTAVHSIMVSVVIIILTHGQPKST